MTTNQTSEAGEMMPCFRCAGNLVRLTYHEDRQYSVKCHGCALVVCFGSTSKADAVQFWNTRTPDTATESHLRAQLAEAEKEREVPIKELAYHFFQRCSFVPSWNKLTGAQQSEAVKEMTDSVIAALRSKNTEAGREVR